MKEVRSLHEECGIAGVFSNRSSAQLTRFCLHHLQHRGQEGCGIVACDEDGKMACVKGAGLVSEVFEDAAEVDDRLSGMSAIGHVRYGTSGGGGVENIQPFMFRLSSGPFAIAHNGNIVNADVLKDQLCREGAIFGSSSDTEVIAHLIHRSGRGSRHGMLDALSYAMNRLDGAVSLLVLVPGAIYACRDRYGFRPLSYGRYGDGYVFASETCALAALGIYDIHDVEPGEIVSVDKDGIHSFRFTENSLSKMCAMEYIYFARTDSTIEGTCVHTFRKNSGRILYEESPADADMVIAVPDSGLSAAIGYAEAGGLPVEMGLVKNRYVGRTFIQPSQEMRESGVRMKLSPLKSVIRGKRLVLIDDSIVRGTTSLKIVRMLREAGAAEIHVRISSPMITSPCFYGVDISSTKELLCVGKTVDEACKAIEADSLAFISEEGLLRAGSRSDLCMACFNKKYPTNLYDNKI